MSAAFPTEAVASSYADGLFDRAFRYAMSLTRERSSAEDLVQDAVVALLERKKEWNAPYLFRTIRNRFIDGCRRERCVPFVPLEGVFSTTDPETAFHQRHDSFEMDRVEHALQLLRDDEREALFLSAVEGFTAEEIAHLTNRPRGTILSLLFRAKRKVREMLGRGDRTENATLGRVRSSDRCRPDSHRQETNAPRS